MGNTRNPATDLFHSDTTLNNIVGKGSSCPSIVPCLITSFCLYYAPQILRHPLIMPRRGSDGTDYRVLSHGSTLNT